MTEVIQSAPLEVFLAMLALPSGIAGIGLFVSVRSARLAQLIDRTPTSSIGSATSGYVELEGTVEAPTGPTLRSRLTDTPVCWYRAKVEEWVSSRSDAPDPTWRTLSDHTSDEPFLLRDSTGVCTVVPRGAEVTPTDRSVWYGATPEPEDRTPPKVGPGEAAEGMLRISGTPGHRYRYTEERIYPGDPLLALGELRLHLDDDQDLDDLDDVEDLDELPADGEARADGHAASRAALCLARPSTGGASFLLSTTPQRELRQAHHVGSRAALTIVALGGVIAGFLVWVRLGG